MFNVFLFTLALFIVLTVLLGVFTVYKNPKSKPATLWFFLSIAISVWSISHFIHLTAETESQAIFFAKMLYVGTVFIPVIFYHFVMSFMMINKDILKNTFLVVGYVLAILLSYVTLTTNLIIAGVSPQLGFPFWSDPGPLHGLAVLHFWGFGFLALKVLLSQMIKKDGVMRRKATFVFFASLFAFLTGGTNFLPQTIGVYPFGSFFAWMYAIFIAYGVYSDGLKIKI